MSTELSAPFFQATHQVLQTMLDLSNISPLCTEQFDGKDSLEISVGIIGDLEGTITYLFPRETSLNIVQILSGMEIEAIDDFVTSAVSEIANIISGTVVTLLSADQITCDILPPVQGRQADNSHACRSTQCCLSTSVGDICLEIRLSPSKSK